MPTKKLKNPHQPGLAIVSGVDAGQSRNGDELARSGDDMWRLVADSAADAIIALTPYGSITLWNRTAESMFGWPADEVIGKLFAETILPAVHREAFSGGLRRFIETGDAVIFDRRLELSAVTKNGREFPIELAIVPQQTSDGQTFVGFIRDMTEHKKLAERLRQSQKMEAIGILAGGIAHDFNNILTAMAGNLLLAKADVPLDHPIQESLSEIEKAVARATYVVRQILTFSSAKKSNAENIDLAMTLQEAVQLLKAALPASMEIEVHSQPGLPAIFANSTDIHQIILNLGINAQHAMGGRGGKFELNISRIELDGPAAESLNVEPGPYVRLSAGDTGCGMDAATLARIFEPFFTTKASGEGTGLGLSVVYGIVTRCQGGLNVSSMPGKGTVFHIYFPAAATPAKKAAPLPALDAEGNGERILYVDDDEALVYMMTRMLRRLNYEVLGLQNPEEALAAFQADPDSFDVVITDMSMPHMDGATLVRALQEIRPTLPIIMVTGYIRPKDLEQALGLGISELILKPNTTSEMGEVLNRVMAESRAQTALALS